MRFSLEPAASLPSVVTDLHPDLVDHLESMGIDLGAMGPGGEAFLRWVDGLCHEVEELRVARGDLTRERSSYENLFQISPIPIMQQDYTRLEAWMEGLRARGVERIEEVVGPDIDSIRSVVPLIDMVAANPAAQRAVGLAPERMLGTIEPRIVNPGSEAGWMAQIRAVWERRPVAHAAFTASTAAGKPYDAESVLAAPLIDGEPDFSRAVFTIIDVTPHRDEERRMQESIQAKDRFLASVSHEVRTPLTAILGFARLLEEEPDLAGPEREPMVAAIAEHAQEVSDLIEDLLVAARAELDQVKVSSQAVDVADQIEQIIGAGGSFTAGVTISVPDGAVTAWCDPARFRQILRNLLTNAERYGGFRKEIRLGTRDGMAEIEVTDDGPGLPETEWERIFDPYHRVHETPGQPGSVGIGLAISRQLAELMAGSLEYRYESGRSVFRMLLPLTD